MKLLKENEVAVTDFGKNAINIWIPQETLSELLSNNNTIYTLKNENCKIEIANAFESLLIKGSIYHFIGQEIVKKEKASKSQITALQVT